MPADDEDDDEDDELPNPTPRSLRAMEMISSDALLQEDRSFCFRASSNSPLCLGFIIKSKNFSCIFQ